MGYLHVPLRLLLQLRIRRRLLLDLLLVAQVGTPAEQKRQSPYAMIS